MPSLLATLGLNASTFHAGLSQAQSRARTVGKEIGSSLGEYASGILGTFGVASLIESTIEAADRIHQLSNEFRVSTDTIQIWDKGARRAGLAAEDIGNAMNRLKKAREEAIGGGATSEKFRDAFGTFGIGMENLKNQSLSTEEIMDRMRSSVAGHPITDAEDVEGMALMGKSGAKVLSALEQIHNLGPINVIKKEDIEALHDYDESLRELKRNATIGVGETVGGLGKFFQATGATFEGLKQFFTGQASFNEARRLAHNTYMGRPADYDANKPETTKAKVTEHAQSKAMEYSITKIVDLNKDAKEIEKLRNDLAEKILANQLKSMTPLERQAALQKQIAEHQKKAIELEFGEGDEKAALLEKLEVEKLKGQLHAGEKAAARHELTANQKIGAYSAGGLNPELKVAEESKRHLEAIRHGIGILTNQRTGQVWKVDAGGVHF